MYLREIAAVSLMVHLVTVVHPQPRNLPTTLFRFITKYYGSYLQSASSVTKDERRINREYDFVIVGAGSGGSVLANRLTEIPEWSVLLLEAGKEEIFLTDVPLLVSYVVGTEYNWGYRTERQPGACLGMKGKRCHWPRGKAMGGTSVINYMVYTRGFKHDYDTWAAMGNEGWSYDDVYPYFLKSEDATAFRDSKCHSRGGYLRVERPAWRSPVAPSFLEACQELGFNFTGDDCTDALGYSSVLANTDRGTRCSASKAFLRPIRTRRNLHVSKQSQVTRLLIDPKRKHVRGVEFVKNRRPYTVFARKEVLVCAGTLNSPQLLMLSGIGPQRHLRELGIPVIQNLSVGYNLQDHVSMSALTFLVNDTVTIVESRYRNLKYMLDYMLDGTGPYTLPGGAEAILFMRTKCCAPEDPSTPDMELVFGPGSLTGDSGGSLKELLNLDDDLYDSVYRPYLGRDAWSLVPVLLKPRSKGYMKLRSKNPFDAPMFYPNYLTDKRDLDALVDGIKQVKIKIFVSYVSVPGGLLTEIILFYF